MSEPIDWGLAASTARWVSAAGPRSNLRQAREETRALREAALVSVEHVRRISGLDVAPDSPVLVVDRPTWARANADSLRVLLTPGLPQASALGASLSGVQAGGLLSLLSTRVLGQYDPFLDRLLLVAPNVMQVRQQLNVRPQDFRLWVCLHEQTHALQFAAAPWLADHLRTTMRELMSTLTETGDGADRLEQLVRALPRMLRGQRSDLSSSSLLDVVLSESERALMAEAMATMSLLEGHADVVMDEVGPQVVPTVRKIRRAFERRRSSTSPIDVLVRRLLGLDAKLAQYRDGARFVRGVVDQLGHDGFNAVWAAPEHLPRAAELADPQAWVRRVHG